MNDSNCWHWCMNNNDIIIIWIQHKGGETSLHYACEAGGIKIVECLIKHGAQIDMQCNVRNEW